MNSGIQFVPMMWLTWLIFEEIPLLFLFLFDTEHVSDILKTILGGRMFSLSMFTFFYFQAMIG